MVLCGNDITSVERIKKAIEKGGLFPAAVNGANEQSVSLFLEGKIGFLKIAELNEAAMENQANVSSYGIDDIFEADRAARRFVSERVN